MMPQSEGTSAPPLFAHPRIAAKNAIQQSTDHYREWDRNPDCGRKLSEDDEVEAKCYSTC